MTPAATAILPDQNQLWLAAAAQLPLGFSQVREDARLDLTVARLVESDAEICMVASGGCTAAYLAATAGARSISLVDTNGAQLALSKLKLHLLQTCSIEARLKLLGHEQMSGEKRLHDLNAIAEKINIDLDKIAPLPLAGSLGLDYCGRYERLFAHLQSILAPYNSELIALLTQIGPAQQAQLIDHTPLENALDAAFTQTFALPNLVALFGTGATANATKPFADHFRQRLQIALETIPANNNPYLHQMLMGRYPRNCKAPWLVLEPAKIGSQIDFIRSDMLTALQNKSKSLDLIYLSNILDWLGPEQAQLTLQAAFDALKPGGMVFIRQLNSKLDIRSCHNFHWSKQAESLHQIDRSFFYQRLHLGIKS